MESEDDQELSSSEILESRKETTNNLPEKSSKRYKIVYNEFINWKTLKQVESFSENVLLAYFDELSKKYKSTSLWSRYSMLRATLALNHDINIEPYCKLRAFLKRKSDSHTAKRANILTAEQVKQFIKEAPDNIHLATKVALIMGVMGACRKTEMYEMKKEDVQELGSALLVIIPNTKTKVVRRFTITNEYYDICKKYINLRPPGCSISAFFLNYARGKCTSQRIGVNKFSNMGKQIAEFLKLPNPNLYTGHCFRRSSAKLALDSGGDITTLKGYEGWKSTTTERYIDLRNKIDTAKKIAYFQNTPPRIATDEHLITNFEEEPITIKKIKSVKDTFYGHNKDLNPLIIENDTLEDIGVNIKTEPEDCYEDMIDAKEITKSSAACIVDTWDSMFHNTMCCISGCSSTAQNCKERGIEMYNFPERQETERLQAWISAVRELNSDFTWESSKFSKICSEHFIGGKKSNIRTDLSYIPTVKIKSDVLVKYEFDTNNLESRNTLQDASTNCDIYTEYNTDTLQKFEKLEKLRKDLMNDDCQIFCNFVATEMRNINPKLRQQLKACIQKSVLEFSEKNDLQCIYSKEKINNNIENKNVQIISKYKTPKS